jgi:hypothetical protein
MVDGTDVPPWPVVGQAGAGAWLRATSRVVDALALPDVEAIALLVAGAKSCKSGGARASKTNVNTKMKRSTPKISETEVRLSLSSSSSYRTGTDLDCHRSSGSEGAGRATRALP